MSKQPREPIAVTGMGLVTSLGLDCQSTWRAMCRGECGVGPAPALESVLHPDPGAGQVKDEVSAAGPAAREIRHLRRALREAFAQANPAANDGCRKGFMVGTTLHGMRHGGKFLRTSDFASLRQFLAGATLAEATEGFGPVAVACTTCSACSSGLASVSLARTLLANRDLDLAIAGGYDPISEYSYAGFNSMRLVSPTTVRPFTADRDGMKVAEGYAVAVLERAEAANELGVAPLAYVLGMGESCDAFHLSKPHPEGAGAAAAIRLALCEAAVEPGDIDLIIAHGTGTLDNDAAEYAALKLVFGEGLPRIPLLATKSHLGHSLGAAGAVDLIIAVLALREGLIPPCGNLSTEAALIGGINPMRGGCRRAALRHVLTISLGFGGANMACVLGAAAVTAERPKAPEAPPNVTGSRLGFGPEPRRTGSARRRVAVSGIGVVVPGGAGNEAFVQLLGSHKEGRGGRSSTVTQEELEPLINARRTRRMSEFAKLTIAATGEALRHAEVTDPALFCEECSAVLATMHGPTEFCESFYRQIVKEGPAAANPSLFAEGVPNVASAHLSTNFGIRGFCQTLIGSRTAGLDALALATARIGNGEWHRAIVGAAEEYTPLLQEVYARLLPAPAGESSPLATSGAVTLILESEAVLAARQGRPLAFVESTASGQLQLRNLRSSRARLRQISEWLDEVDGCICTMNQTWIDGLERRLLPRRLRSASLSMYPLVGEAFSVGPLLGLAAGFFSHSGSDGVGFIPPSVRRLGVVCADYFGSISAGRIAFM